MLTIIPFIIFLLFSECSSGRRDVRQIDVELRPVGVEGDQPFTALIFTATTATPGLLRDLNHFLGLFLVFFYLKSLLFFFSKNLQLVSFCNCLFSIGTYDFGKLK